MLESWRPEAWSWSLRGGASAHRLKPGQKKGKIHAMLSIGGRQGYG